MATAPTVGRKMYYRHNVVDDYFQVLSDQPFDATVIHVNENSTVNLWIIDHCGNSESICDVPVRQPEDEAPTDSSYVEWMPYQVAQAASQVAKKE